jgi:hemolysin III
VWKYDRGEVIADGVVHVLGIAFGVVATILLTLVAVHWAGPAERLAVLVYGAALLAVLGFSAAYNLWPISPRKWLLRRFDHSAIYLLIAGTYTPFMVQLKSSLLSTGLLVGIWCTAAVGIVLKLFFPGRLDRLSIALYLLMGWSGVIAYRPVSATLATETLWLLAAGGLVYTAGVVFHVWQSLRFQNAIWHGCVLLAMLFHYSAVWTCLA